MRTNSRLSSAILLLLAAFVSPAVADPPHFASVRRDQAFLREGPSYDHRVLWVYQRKDYPLRVVESYDAWRRVKDVDGTVGWMHHTQLSDTRTVLFVGAAKSIMRAGAAPSSKIVAFAMPGVVARLKACKTDVCEVETSGVDGWVDRKTIWGVDAGEVFQ